MFALEGFEGMEECWWLIFAAGFLVTDASRGLESESTANSD